MRLLTSNINLIFSFSGELAQAIQKNTNLVFGLYHSLFEWFNPLYLKDQANSYHTQDYVKVADFFFPSCHVTFGTAV